MHGKYSDSWQARYECFSVWLLLLLYAFHPQKYHAPENRTKSIFLLNSAKTWILDTQRSILMFDTLVWLHEQASEIDVWEQLLERYKYIFIIFFEWIRLSIITKHKFVKFRRGVNENNDNYNNHNSRSRSNNKCWQDLKASSICSM